MASRQLGQASTQARKKLQTIFKTLEKENVRNIVFYGVNDFTEIAFISLQETSIQIVAVMDEEKIGENFLNFRIISFVELPGIAFDRILIIQMDSDTKSYDQLKSMGVVSSKILKVYIHG